MEKMKKICKTIKGDRQLLAGMIGIVILLALVILAPVVASENPHHYGKDILNSLGQNGHLLGTNHMGQDIYSMIIYGVRTSLRVAVISALISGVLGVLIGGVAGFFWWESGHVCVGTDQCIYDASELFPDSSDHLLCLATVSQMLW